MWLLENEQFPMWLMFGAHTLLLLGGAGPEVSLLGNSQWVGEGKWGQASSGVSDGAEMLAAKAPGKLVRPALGNRGLYYTRQSGKNSMWQFQWKYFYFWNLVSFLNSPQGKMDYCFLEIEAGDLKVFHIKNRKAQGGGK